MMHSPQNHMILRQKN